MVTVPLKEIVEEKIVSLVEIQVSYQSPKLPFYDRTEFFF